MAITMDDLVSAFSSDVHAGDHGLDLCAVRNELAGMIGHHQRPGGYHHAQQTLPSPVGMSPSHYAWSSASSSQWDTSGTGPSPGHYRPASFSSRSFIGAGGSGIVAPSTSYESGGAFPSSSSFSPSAAAVGAAPQNTPITADPSHLEAFHADFTAAAERAAREVAGARGQWPSDGKTTARDHSQLGVVTASTNSKPTKLVSGFEIVGGQSASAPSNASSLEGNAPV